VGGATLFSHGRRNEPQNLKNPPTLLDPMDCSPPGSFVHGISQARILEWVPIPFSRGSSQSRDRTWVSGTAGRFFTVWTTKEALSLWKILTYGRTSPPLHNLWLPFWVGEVGSGRPPAPDWWPRTLPDVSSFDGQSSYRSPQDVWEVTLG